MNRTAEIILSISMLLIFSCTEVTDAPQPRPERDISMPEMVEKEIGEVLSKDWKSLSDTLTYFNSALLSKGHFKGKAPDGVFYELSISLKDSPSLTLDFKVEDSTWVTVNGRIIPIEISLNAFGTEIAIEKEGPDSTSLRFSKVVAVCPDRFLFEDEHKANLLYGDRRVGFITREEFENADYSTGKYLVVHYYDDPRTFSLYDNGFTDLMKISLRDVLE